MEALINMEFTAFVALAFLLYVIRRATKISKGYLPIIAVVLGIGMAAFEEMSFNFDVVMLGLKNALYAVAIAFGAKFAQTEYFNRRNKGTQETGVGIDEQKQSNKNPSNKENSTNSVTTQQTKTKQNQPNNNNTNVNHRY